MFYLKRRKSSQKESGISLFEVMIALSLLAIVLLSALSVRLITRGNQELNRAQLTGIALIRQAGMDFACARIFSDTNQTGVSETGYPYLLNRKLETNTLFGFERMNLDVSIEGDEQNQRFGIYGSRVRPLRLGDANTPWWNLPPSSEPLLDSSTGRYELIVQSSDTNKGTVQGSGFYYYNTQVTIRAEPKSGHTFIKWQGANVLSETSPQTSLYIGDDLQVEAVFQ